MENSLQEPAKKRQKIVDSRPKSQRQASKEANGKMALIRDVETFGTFESDMEDDCVRNPVPVL